MVPLDKRLARFGLSFHPFAGAVPPAACLTTPDMAHVLARCDHLVASGGFATIVGEPGTGKSTLLRLVHARLSQRTDLVLGILTRPQASVADFYRELGALFDVALTPHNRWAGARVLRDRWLSHWTTTHQRPVLIIDEAQEMHPLVLGELRLLASADLDAVALMTIILGGDARLTALLQTAPLLPLASRIRIHHQTTAASIPELVQLLEHLLTRAGNPTLMTEGLKRSLAEHACGSRRSLIFLCDQLLEAAVADPACDQLDEHLFTRTVTPTAGTPSAHRPRKVS